MGKKIILLLLLTLAVFGQDKYWYYYWNQDGTIYTETPVVLPSLVANSDTVWAGNYFPLAVYNDTVRYDSVTNIYATIWRRNSDRTFNRVGITEDLFPSVVDSGTCNINLATPIAARIGDYFGWRIVAGGTTYEGISLSNASRIGQDGNITKVKFWYDDGIPFNFCHSISAYGITVSNYTDSIAYCDSAIAQLTNKDFLTGTTLDSLNHFSIHFYETPAPVIVAIGDSWMSAWYVDRTWVEPTTRATYSPTASITYALSAYANVTNQNVGMGADVSAQMLSRGFQVVAPDTGRDVTMKNPVIVIMHGSNNDLNGSSSTTAPVTRVRAIMDSCIANGFDFYYLQNGHSQLWDSLNSARIDTISSAIKVFIDSNYSNGCHFIPIVPIVCQNRASVITYPENLWDIKPACNAGDNSHLTKQANGLIARIIIDTLKKFYTLTTDTTVIYWNVPAFTDTGAQYFPMSVAMTVDYDLGVDSVKLSHNRNGVAGTTLNLSNNYVGIADTFKGTWFIPNLAIGDTINYTWTAYAYDKTKTESGTFYITGTAIPTDSLKIAYEFQFDRGAGINTVATKMLNLVNNQDTLTLVNAPTDSTAEGGYLYFNGTDEYATLTSKTFTTPYTIIMKVKGYTFAGAITLCWSWDANWYGAQHNGTAIAGLVGGSDFILYRLNHLLDNDTVTAWTSTGDLYKAGTLKVDNSFSNSFDAAATINLMSHYDNTLQFPGRLYCFYYYNRILTQEEIAKFK